MRRWTMLLAAAALALALAGCGLMRLTEQEEPLRLYYCYADPELGAYDGETGALGWETDSLLPADAAVEQVLERYFQGPQTETLANPFPPDLTVEDWSLEGGCLTLTLSDALQELFGMERTVAAACVVWTMTQLPEVESVRLTTGQSDAADSLMDKPLTTEQFLLTDASARSNQTSA